MTKYTPVNGYSAGLSFSDLKIDLLTMRISLISDNYKGSFYAQDGGQGGHSETSAEVEKTAIGLGLYPLNFAVFKKMRFSVGGEFNYNIYESLSGYKSTWMITDSNSYMTIENDSVKINKDFVWGMSVWISDDFRINKDWAIAPSY